MNPADNKENVPPAGAPSMGAEAVGSSGLSSLLAAAKMGQPSHHALASKQQRAPLSDITHLFHVEEVRV